MKLRDLIKDLDVIEILGDANIDIDNLSYHTNSVNPNSCFFAINGNAADGHDFISIAVENGAKVIVSSKCIDAPTGIVNVVVNDTRLALAKMSASFFGNSSSKLKLIGITGTNGKTTITYLLESIWNACSIQSGVIGTVNYRYADIKTNPKHTTPESYELQKLFKNMSEAGVENVAMEVSSHSLSQERIAGCEIDGAIFTNLTQDHLDYHLDMQRYKEAKALLFNEYLPASSKQDVWAVMNLDDDFGRELTKTIKNNVCTYSLFDTKSADVFLEDVKYSFSGTVLKVRVADICLEIKSRLIGKHNASNILAAIAAAYMMKIPFNKIEKGLENLQKVPGRLEPVPNKKHLNVLVDYAHTPDALKNVTSVLKELKPRKLITVFGCGGDRDKSKRPKMGFETALKSDIVIVTSDNPRSEHPMKIIDEIVGGIRELGLEKSDGTSPGFIVEVNRKEAIKKAITIASKSDIVLIAGKGHEDYQIIGKEKIPFDDLNVAKEIIDNLYTRLLS